VSSGEASQKGDYASPVGDPSVGQSIAPHSWVVGEWHRRLPCFIYCTCATETNRGARCGRSQDRLWRLVLADGHMPALLLARGSLQKHCVLRSNPQSWQQNWAYLLEVTSARQGSYKSCASVHVLPMPTSSERLTPQHRLRHLVTLYLLIALQRHRHRQRLRGRQLSSEFQTSLASPAACRLHAPRRGA
jgi:hypothetical protein